MTFIIILMMILMIAFIATSLSFTSYKNEDPQFCKLMQESCQYPILNNCRNCPIYKENIIK